jgi:hypothetical protein
LARGIPVRPRATLLGFGPELLPGWRHDSTLSLPASRDHVRRQRFGLRLVVRFVGLVRAEDQVLAVPGRPVRHLHRLCSHSSGIALRLGAAAGVLMVALVVVANIYVLAFAVDAGERSRMRT